MLAVTKLNKKWSLSKTSEIFLTECSSHLFTFSDVTMFVIGRSLSMRNTSRRYYQISKEEERLLMEEKCREEEKRKKKMGEFLAANFVYITTVMSMKDSCMTRDAISRLT